MPAASQTRLSTREMQESVRLSTNPVERFFSNNGIDVQAEPAFDLSNIG
jgi:hypothetical protein